MWKSIPNDTCIGYKQLKTQFYLYSIVLCTPRLIYTLGNLQCTVAYENLHSKEA